MIIYIADNFYYVNYDDEKLEGVNLNLQIHNYHRPLVDSLSVFENIIIPINKKCFLENHKYSNGNMVFRHNVLSDLNELIKLIKLLVNNRNCKLVFDVYSLKTSLIYFFICNFFNVKKFAIVTDRIEDSYKDSFLRRVLAKFLIKNAQGVFAINQNLAEFMKPLNSNFCVLPPPTKIFQDTTNNRNLSNIICYAGSIYEINGINELVAAVSEMESIKEIDLEIYGQIDPSYKEDFFDIIANKRVYYKGVYNLEALSEMVNKCDVFIEPRGTQDDFTNYSYPSKINFYLSQGRVVICTNLKGLPEEVKNKMIIIEDNSPETIKAGILRFYQMSIEDRMKLEIAAKYYVDNNYSSDALAKKMFEFMENIKN